MLGFFADWEAQDQNDSHTVTAERSDTKATVDYKYRIEDKFLE